MATYSLVKCESGDEIANRGLVGFFILTKLFNQIAPTGALSSNPVRGHPVVVYSSSFR